VSVAAVEVVRAHGLEIAYERVGAGPPLVLVHGATVDAHIWQPQLAALADELTVVAWDEPGAGRSSDVPADFGPADYVHCLAALIDALALGPAHVAGLSWGGTVVLELYRHHLELVATLILVDTYPAGRGRCLSRRCGLGRGRAADARRAGRRIRPDASRAFAGDPPAEHVPLLKAMAADVRPQSMGTALLAMAERDQRDLLPHSAVC